MMIKSFLKKEILLIFFLSILISGLIYFFNSSKNEPVEAGTEHNVFGWAWSSNIGWISFNSTPGGGAVNYGVNIGSDGTLSGYAWSQNIGWIRFDPPDDPYPGPPNHSARLDSDKRITGWIRALNHNDDWDGWIFLGPIIREGIDYGVKISDTNPPQFEGWAWGSDVIGWISFNCNNQEVCQSSDYKVSTTFTFNQPPTPPGVLEETWNHCTYQGISIPTFRWIYSDPEGDPQVRYEIKWNNTSTLVTGASTAYTLTLEEARSLNWNATYTWQVKVEDSRGNWSKWSNLNDFTTPIRHYPWVEFYWYPEFPDKRQRVDFTNTSTISAPPAVARWTFQDANTTSVDAWHATGTEFHSDGWKEVTLTVRDAEDYSCRKIDYVNVGRVATPTPPLPQRYEVVPIR